MRIHRTKNPLNDSIFTDGKIEQITRTDQGLELLVRDYCGSTVQVRLIGVTDTVISDDVHHYEVMDAGFIRTRGRLDYESQG